MMIHTQLCCGLFIYWVVVWNIFYFHPYLGKIPNLTNIFHRGWNHQLALLWFSLFMFFSMTSFFLWVFVDPKQPCSIQRGCVCMFFGREGVIGFRRIKGSIHVSPKSHRNPTSSLDLPEEENMQCVSHVSSFLPKDGHVRRLLNSNLTNLPNAFPEATQKHLEGMLGALKTTIQERKRVVPPWDAGPQWKF